MLLPEFKTILMLDGWTMEECPDFILWKKEGVILQWDVEPEYTIHKQLIFRSYTGFDDREGYSAYAYSSFQECINDFE